MNQFCEPKQIVNQKKKHKHIQKYSLHTFRAASKFYKQQSKDLGDQIPLKVSRIKEAQVNSSTLG